MVMGWSAQDVSAVISATGGMFSAVMAGLAFASQIKSQRAIDKEKEEMSKARFYEIGWFMTGKVMKIRVDNRSPSPVYDVIGELKVNKNVKVSINEPSRDDNCDFIIEIDFNLCDTSISDILKLKYKNIYGKEFESSKNIFVPIGTNEKTNLGHKSFLNN